ncbi:hypothetical protein BDV06DRAFT_234358 [Aspergillus oleicola]
MFIEISILGLLVIFRTILLAEALPSSSTAQNQSHNHPSKPSFGWSTTQHVLAFGDSYTYIQGMSGHPNYSFIGDEQSYAYDARTLLSDQIVQNQTGTSAGGPNWIEYLTGCGVEPGFTYPVECERQLWDFAFAGAGVSAEFIPLHHDYTISLVRQIEQFVTYGHPVLTSSPNPTKSPKHKGEPILSPSSTLTTIWIGINDINDSAGYNLTIPQFALFYDTLIARVFESIGELSNLGYRDIVLLNLPPLDRTPANQLRTREGEEGVPSSRQVQLWNDLLKKQSQSFQDGNPGSSVLVFDANSLLNAVLDEPGRYGISNTTDFCPGVTQPDIGTAYEKYGCPTPLSTYFWFDSGHVTGTVHRVLANALDTVLKRQRGD